MHAEGKLYIAGINDNPYRILGISSLATRDDAWDALQAVRKASRLKIALLMRSFDVPHILGVVKRFSVFKRYGAKCAVCSVSRSEMLQAAHLRPVSEKGSDDPRNGLVFSVTIIVRVLLRVFDRITGLNPVQVESSSSSIRRGKGEALPGGQRAAILHQDKASIPNTTHYDRSMVRRFCQRVQS